MNRKRKAGILLHPTSLPSDFGIGDLGENARKFVDFLQYSGLELWQILPLGPTSFGDSPYQSFSTFAGNPLLISPEILLDKGYIHPSDLEEAAHFPKEKTDYGAIIPWKKELLEKAFSAFQKTSGAIQKQFQDFCKKNDFWLTDYALFSALKDYFIQERKNLWQPKDFLAFSKKMEGVLEENVKKDYYYGAVWSTWPEDIAQRKPFALKQWKEKLKDSIESYQFQQFEFYCQWQNLLEYAHEQGIQIIGDIPIFVAYDSADVWANPENFYMNSDGFPTVVAGVPPDYFSETGQLWGNPLYQWDTMKETGYQWWINRIEHTLHLVDILRIDHFRGFESYWAVPFGDKTAIGGQWKPGPGIDLFQKIKQSLGQPPIIAEDLGIITDKVRALREYTGFPGMRVLQFAFDGNGKNSYLPHEYEPNAVVYTGTHDNDTTLGWYLNASAKEQDHFRRYMNVNGNDCAWDLIRLAMASTARYCIFPLQDVLRLDSPYRMNTPGTQGNNWQFRFQWAQIPEEAAGTLRYFSSLFDRLPIQEESTTQLEKSEE